MLFDSQMHRHSVCTSTRFRLHRQIVIGSHHDVARDDLRKQLQRNDVGCISPVDSVLVHPLPPFEDLRGNAHEQPAA